jgi:predicted RNA binding protein with dsRBD fold (UPF0201 family)
MKNKRIIMLLLLCIIALTPIVFAEAGEITLTVEDSTGFPIMGATVESTSVPEEQSELSGTTGFLGQITFQDLILGEYTFNVTMDGYVTATVTIQVDEATAYEETVTLLDEDDVDEFGEITLTIEDLDGSPIVDATVESTSVPEEQSELSGTTGSDGQVTFQDLILGEYTFNVTMEGYVTETVTIQVDEVTVYAETVTLSSVDEFGEIRIAVEDTDGSPISGALVESTSVPDGQDVLSGTTDADGMIRFQDLILGSYTFNVSMDGYVTATVTIQVDEATVYEETVTLLDEDIEFGEITLTVEDTDGAPIVGATVESTSVPEEQSELSGTTDSDGQVTFQVLILGSYTFDVSMDGYLTDTVTIQVDEFTVYEETVTLETAPIDVDAPDWTTWLLIGAVIIAVVAVVAYWMRSRR